MVRYHNFDIVFAEIPCETTLAINITNCPNRCRGCHSPHLQADMGRVLDEAELCGILARYGRSVTCVCFMGGDAAPHEIAALADVVRRKFPMLHTGWYSGRARLPEGLRPQSFDYIKLGGWVEELGPLTSPTTNQRLYRVGADGAMQDITELFRRRPWVFQGRSGQAARHPGNPARRPYGHHGVIFSAPTMAVCPKWTIFALVMKTRQELTEILDFIAEYATYLLGSGVHTSRVIRNSQRIGASQGVDLQLSSFQKSTIITAHDEESGEAITRVVKIPALPISFERNSDLSALSWDALDERLPLSEIRRRYDELTAKPRIDPIFVLLTVGLANASFCRLFGGDWIAMSIVFTSTLVGFAAKQRMQAHGVNHFLIFIISAFMASLCASAALRFDCSAETALATSVLFLVPGVPLINGVIDIVEGHILIGCSRLINALLLIICIAIGLSATLLMVKDGLL